MNIVIKTIRQLFSFRFWMCKGNPENIIEYRCIYLWNRCNLDNMYKNIKIDLVMSGHNSVYKRLYPPKISK